MDRLPLDNTQAVVSSTSSH